MQRSILIIDDQKDYLELLRLRLETEGYMVLEASSGREGIKIAKESMPEIILLDLMMPDMDGFEVCSELKIESSTKQIPIIMLTAKRDPIDKTFAKGVGVVDYINKPFSAKELLEKMEKYILENSYE